MDYETGKKLDDIQETLNTIIELLEKILIPNEEQTEETEQPIETKINQKKKPNDNNTDEQY